MEFRLLGPLEVVRDGERVALGGDRQRALMALLLLHRREVVSADRLIEELWGESAPPTATKTLQAHVSRLRKALGGEVLETHGHGYRLLAPPESVDVDRFEALIAAAREAAAEGDPGEARALLTASLELWRGPPLADLTYEPFVAGEIARLDDLSHAAREDLVDARLALGEHRSLVPELEALARAHPTRERLVGQLMLALYRSSAQGRALEWYRRARAALVEELGVEPGSELRDLHHRILEQDPALDAPPRTSRAVAPVRGRLRRGRVFVGAGCVVLALAGLTAAILAAEGENPQARVTLRAGAIGTVSPRTGEIITALHVGGAPVRMAADGGTLWVGNDRSRAVAAIAGRRSAIDRTIAADAYPTDVASSGGTVWVLDRERGSLLEVRRGYDRVTRRIRLPGARRDPFLHDRRPPEPWSVAADRGGAWVTDGSRRLFRVAAGEGGGMRRVDAGREVGGVAVDGSGVWAISHRPPSVVRIAARSGAVTARIPISGRRGFASPYPIAVEAGAGAVWVLNANTGTVSRIDPELRAVTSTVQVGVEHVPVRLAVGAGAVWVAAVDGTLTRIEPRTGAVSMTVIGGSLGDVAVVDGKVWVSTGRGGAGSAPAPAREAVAAGGVRPLPPSFCSPVYTAPGARPDALVASDMPLQGSFGIEGVQITAAVRLVMRERGFRAGRHELGLQGCDHSAAGTRQKLEPKCKANAETYAANRSVIGVIGPFNSQCAAVGLAALNAAGDGPLASISPSATYVGLTRAGVGTAQDEPEVHRPTGRPSFARLVPADDVQGVALALLARELGLRRVVVLDTDDAYARLLTNTFRETAAEIGRPIAGTVQYSLTSSARNARVPARVRRARPDAVFFSGYLVPETGALLKRLLRAVGPDVRILAPDGFVADFLVDEIGSAAEGMLISQPGPSIHGLPPRGRRFVEAFTREVGSPPLPYTLYAAQATEVLLDAISRSDGTRASVAHELFRTRVRGGLMPDFEIAHSGDTTLTNVTIYEIRDGRQRVLRDITPPPSLLETLRGR